jgi:hypothetical protein
VQHLGFVLMLPLLSLAITLSTALITNLGIPGQFRWISRLHKLATHIGTSTCSSKPALGSYVDTDLLLLRLGCYWLFLRSHVSEVGRVRCIDRAWFTLKKRHVKPEFHVSL